ncbi:MAG: hypothetical protein M3Q39_08345 [Actinomycetota bacterium]|nr:hypothetical protein [Actinomycetota bacterium]
MRCWPGAAYRSGLCHVLGAARDTELGFWPARQEPAPTGLGKQLTDSVRPWELTDALTHSTISTTTLDHMERAVFSYTTRYPATPPTVLLPAVSGQLPRLHDALNRPQPLRTRRRAVTLLGVLSGLAGNLWLDLGREDQAAEFFDVGELAGQEAEDPDLTAWVLATRSIGPFFAGQHQHAAGLLARAEDAAALQSSPRRRAWVVALRARAAAAAGDHFQSHAALEQAHQYMGAVSEPPSDTEFFDAPRLDGMAGTTYLLMTDTHRAVPLLTQARDRRAPTEAKGRALVTLDLADCHAVDHEPEEAVRLAVQALDAVDESMVAPILTRARTLRAGLERWSDLPAVQELDTRLVVVPRG